MNWLKVSIGVLLLIVSSLSLYWLLPVKYLDTPLVEIGIVLLTISAAVMLKRFAADNSPHTFQFIKSFDSNKVLIAGFGLVGLGFAWFAISALLISDMSSTNRVGLSDGMAELVVLPALLFFASGLSLVIFRVFQWFSN